LFAQDQGSAHAASGRPRASRQRGQNLFLPQTTRKEKNLPTLRGWEHTIADRRDFMMHLDYIHVNPVKHGLAQWPADWPWSSFHRYLKDGWYEPNWCGHVNIKGVRYLEP